MIVSIGTLIGGIGIFLLAMMMLTDTLKRWSGDRLRQRLNQFTEGPIDSALFGATLTTLFQSSTVTTLMTVGFVSAGLLTFGQSLGVIIGSNIGSATTGWIVAVLGYTIDVRSFLLPLIGLGMVMKFVGGKVEKPGMLFVSVGLVFVGIGTIQDAMKTLTERFDIAHISPDTWWSQLLLIGLGLLMTVILQSSSIGLVLTMTALASGTITLLQAGFLTLGQSAGTSIVVAIGAASTWRTSRRIVWAHASIHSILLLFGWLTMPLLWRGVNSVADWLGWNDLLRLALFHTSFHLLVVALLLPFTSIVSRRFAPEAKGDIERMTRFLGAKMVEVPAVALEAARRSLLEITKVMAEETIAWIERKERTDEVRIAIEQAMGEVRLYLSQIRIDVGSNKNEYGRHVSLLHSLEHLERWLNALKDPPNTDEADYREARDILLVELNQVTMLTHHSGAEDVEPFRDEAKRLAELREEKRALWLEETATRRLDMEATMKKVSDVTWFDRVGFRSWRTVRHLIKPTARSEGFDVNVEG